VDAEVSRKKFVNKITDIRRRLAKFKNEGYLVQDDFEAFVTENQDDTKLFSAITSQMYNVTNAILSYEDQRILLDSEIASLRHEIDLRKPGTSPVASQIPREPPPS
jgi:hypothetical protein